MNIKIRLAKQSDLFQYGELLQKTYQDAYVNETLGLPKELFSEKVFSSDRIQKYFRSNLKKDGKQKCWVVLKGPELIGTITIVEKDDHYELRGFYVATKYQGKGIGKKLWELARKFAKKKDIVLDTYSHVQKSIAMYKKWGFKIDNSRGELFREWPEWPGGVRAKYIYMRYKTNPLL